MLFRPVSCRAQDIAHAHGTWDHGHWGDVVAALQPKAACSTQQLLLTGAEGWSRTSYIELVQRFHVPEDIAKHLSENYGDRAPHLVRAYSATRLHPDYPFVEGEVRYGMEHELACTAMDVLARRLRLAFLDVRATQHVLPRVLEVMGKQGGWSAARKRAEAAQAEQFLHSMGLNILEAAERDGK